MLVVVALGGNALARRGEPVDMAVQRRNAGVAAAAVAEVARHHWVVVTHGNGPQVGLLALQSEAYREGPVMPLDVLGAESEGMVGYLLAQELGRLTSPDRVVSLLTQVVVDPCDPAFGAPAKPIGPVFPSPQADILEQTRGWRMAPDTGGVRRVVASPEPLDLVELAAVRALLDTGFIPVCAGGGGIPVIADRAGYRGVEAVVDKDLSAALLAAKLHADALLLVTDVDGVYDRFGTPDAVLMRTLDAATARSLALPPGSMGPKVEAACRFAERGGRAVIGALEDVSGLLAGRAGTLITQA